MPFLGCVRLGVCISTFRWRDRFGKRPHKSRPILNSRLCGFHACEGKERPLDAIHFIKNIPTFPLFPIFLFNELIEQNRSGHPVEAFRKCLTRFHLFGTLHDRRRVNHHLHVVGSVIHRTNAVEGEGDGLVGIGRVD